jgi:hypothetical protein
MTDFKMKEFWVLEQVKKMGSSGMRIGCLATKKGSKDQMGQMEREQM